MKMIAMLASAAVVLAAAGCNFGLVEGSGNVVTETREVSGITSVGLSCSGDLVVVQNGTESLVVSADDNILPLLVTEVESGRLTIGLKPGTRVRPSAPMHFELSVDRLEALSISGSGSASVDSLRTPALNVAVSGSGEADVRGLVTGPVAVAISGSGLVSFEGNADSQSIAVSGSGGYDGGELNTKTASVAVSGSGDVVLWATEKLEAQVSGSGSVTYYGDPVVEERVSGSGSVRGLGPRAMEL